jgi:hypothetical protein
MGKTLNNVRLTNLPQRVDGPELLLVLLSAILDQVDRLVLVVDTLQVESCE